MLYHVIFTSLRGVFLFHHLPLDVRLEVNRGPELFLFSLMLEVIKQSWLAELQRCIGKHYLELLQPVQLFNIPLLLDNLYTICHFLEQG